MRSGRARFRLDFGRLDGKRVRVSSIPSPAGNGDRLPISDEETARRVLDSIRAEMVSGKTLTQALKPYHAGTASEDLVGTQLGLYVTHWEKLVASKRKSPNTLREIKTYARADGALAYWNGWSIHRIGYADIEDWQLVLGERINPHTGEPISLKTQKNISDRFRSFLFWLHKRGKLSAVPKFPEITVPDADTDTLEPEEQRRVLDAIPHELRGAFLAAANHSLRMGEVRALDIDDYRDGKLHVAKAIQGPRAGAPIGDTKNDSKEWIEIWNPELVEWIEARLAKMTAEARLRGEIALFPNPRAYSEENPSQRWTPSAMRRAWSRACKAAKVKRITFQEGTRHSTSTALAEHLPERLLRKFTRHRNAKSLDHYTRRVKPAKAQIRDIMTREPR